MVNYFACTVYHLCVVDYGHSFHTNMVQYTIGLWGILNNQNYAVRYFGIQMPQCISRCSFPAQTSKLFFVCRKLHCILNSQDTYTRMQKLCCYNTEMTALNLCQIKYLNSNSINTELQLHLINTLKAIDSHTSCVIHCSRGNKLID